LRGSKAVRPMS